MARGVIYIQDPDWLIGLPPCTSFSIWNYAMNHHKMDKANVQAAVAEARIHFRKHMLRGKHCLYEPIDPALSWKEDSIVAIAKDPTFVLW